MGVTLHGSYPAGGPRCTHQGILDKLFHRRGQVRDDLSRANPGNRDLVDRYDARLLHSHDHWGLDHTPYPPNTQHQVPASDSDTVISAGKGHNGTG